MLYIFIGHYYLLDYIIIGLYYYWKNKEEKYAQVRMGAITN